MESHLVGGKPVGYFTSVADNLNSVLLRTNPAGVRISSTPVNVFMTKEVKSKLEHAEVFSTTVVENSVQKMSLDPILRTLNLTSQ